MIRSFIKLWKEYLKTESELKPDIDINISYNKFLIKKEKEMSDDFRGPEKFALLVGINKYQPHLNADLRGCVNDVKNMYDILVNLYGFKPDNIRVLTDERATKANILHRLQQLISDDKGEGDELVFHFSGHGCFTGDTKISLLNGEEKSFIELTEEYKDKKFWVYSYDKGKIVPGLAHSPRITKYSKVIKITLDNNEVIECTEDHKFMLRDGTYTEAKNLTKEDSLMPLYRKYSGEEDRIQGYEQCYIPDDSTYPTNLLWSKDNYHYTHQIVSYEMNYFENGYKGVIHHNDYNKRNNEPENLKLMTRSEHAKIHSHSPERKEKDRQTMLHWNTVQFPERIKNDPEFRKKFGKASSKARKKNWLDEEYREKVVNGIKDSFDKNNINDDPRVIALHNNREKSHTKEARQKAVTKFKDTINNIDSKFYKTSHSEERKLTLIEANKIANHKRWHVNRDIISDDCELCKKVVNHKIIKIEYLSDIEVPVYDITVDDYHNFALTAGVFVHNSQIRDRDGDELYDFKDELLCPHDLNWEDVLTDDILADLIDELPEGVNFTMICDSCHSGSMTRGLNPHQTNPHPPKARFIEPPFDIMTRSFGRDLQTCRFGRNNNNLYNAVDKGQNHVLISGCKDDQTSADAYIDGKWQGALTSALTKAIKEKADRNWITIHADVLQLLKNGNYTQIPQLSGEQHLLKDRDIFGGKE